MKLLIPNLKLMRWCAEQMKIAAVPLSGARVSSCAPAHGVQVMDQGLSDTDTPRFAFIGHANGGVQCLHSGGNSASKFAQLVATVVTECGAPGAAIVLAHCCMAKRPMAPGERPDYREDRRECLAVCVQTRKAELKLLVPLVNGFPSFYSEPCLTRQDMGLGRFVPDHVPTAAERAAARSALAQIGAGAGLDGRYRVDTEAADCLVAFNPSAIPG